MLSWSSRFSISFFLDSNGYADRYGKYECMLAVGAAERLAAEDANAFSRLQSIWKAQQDWLFGHLCYDLKNVLQAHLQSRNSLKHHFPLMQFIVPEIVCFVERGKDELIIESLNDDAEFIYTEILKFAAVADSGELPLVEFKSRFNRNEYLDRITSLKNHIRDGDCYEITFCNEALAENVSIDPREVFRKLNARSPAPFAAFYQDGYRNLICASPERFLTKSASTLRSQPIKGTSRRSANADEDLSLKQALLDSEKERAENVMITDLVRNDLAISSVPGSVHVDELFGIYTFPQVHQMISTISSTLRDDVNPLEAIAAAFPMGSMTGAPKHRVMQLIDYYEAARRELFSGSVGYISPDGDFDFNVIIRSLFYESEKKLLSYQTGGAITWDSDPEMEWEEMRLKARAICQLFKS
jgi:para-aminobenzoate synthetase component 1